MGFLGGRGVGEGGGEGSVIKRGFFFGGGGLFSLEFNLLCPNNLPATSAPSTVILLPTPDLFLTCLPTPST